MQTWKCRKYWFVYNIVQTTKQKYFLKTHKENDENDTILSSAEDFV